MGGFKLTTGALGGKSIFGSFGPGGAAGLGAVLALSSRTAGAVTLMTGVAVAFSGTFGLSGSGLGGAALAGAAGLAGAGVALGADFA
jgi:hypothetical protein